MHKAGLNVGLLGATDISSSLAEVEEESNPFVNNGLPTVKYFSEITRNVSEADQYFFLVQMTSTTIQSGFSLAKKQIDQTVKYKIDTSLNSAAVFYNRTLISRAQTFFHQATVNKIQNASAEADFDSRVAALQQRTQDKVTKLLSKSIFEVQLSMKGADLLVPDDTNFEQSKFLLLQTGSVVVRSRQAGDRF